MFSATCKEGNSCFSNILFVVTGPEHTHTLNLGISLASGQMPSPLHKF